MNKSESIKELAKALNAFQSEVSGAKKSAVNPFFKSKYANLEEVINCAKDAMANNGLSISQFPITGDKTAGVETILMHSSGEYISSVLLLSVSKNDPQGMGSAITYARRYALQAMAGIPSEDDDGNAPPEPPPVTLPEGVQSRQGFRVHGVVPSRASRPRCAAIRSNNSMDSYVRSSSVEPDRSTASSPSR